MTQLRIGIRHEDKYAAERRAPLVPRHVAELIRKHGLAVSYTHLRAHETPEHLVCRLLLEKKKKTQPTKTELATC